MNWGLRRTSIFTSTFAVSDKCEYLDVMYTVLFHCIVVCIVRDSSSELVSWKCLEYTKVYPVDCANVCVGPCCNDRINHG